MNIPTVFTTAPDDYTSVLPSVLLLPDSDLPPNDRQHCENITIMDDAVCENNETFTLMLTRTDIFPPNGMLDPSMATITIEDNEGTLG